MWTFLKVSLFTRCYIEGAQNLREHAPGPGVCVCVWGGRIKNPGTGACIKKKNAWVSHTAKTSAQVDQEEVLPPPRLGTE